MNSQPIHKQDLSQTLLVKEIFTSIQGEGPFVGHPATFVRLGRCNLQCSFCDTDYTSDLTEMSVTQIISECDKELVVITGGEPFLYDLTELVNTLNSRRHKVQIETNGTLKGRYNAYIVCSPKTQGINVKPDCIKLVFGQNRFINDLDVPVYLMPLDNENKQDVVDAAIALNYIYSPRLQQDINIR